MLIRDLQPREYAARLLERRSDPSFQMVAGPHLARHTTMDAAWAAAPDVRTLLCLLPPFPSSQTTTAMKRFQWVRASELRHLMGERSLALLSAAARCLGGQDRWTDLDSLLQTAASEMETSHIPDVHTPAILDLHMSTCGGKVPRESAIRSARAFAACAALDFAAHPRLAFNSVFMDNKCNPSLVEVAGSALAFDLLSKGAGIAETHAALENHRARSLAEAHDLFSGAWRTEWIASECARPSEPPERQRRFTWSWPFGRASRGDSGQQATASLAGTRRGTPPCP